MPARDGTGPRGMGAMTGRQLGYCTGYAAPGYAPWGLGCGFGLARGGGRGWRHRFLATGVPGVVREPTPFSTAEEERLALRQQVTLLSQRLQMMESRLAALHEAYASPKPNGEEE